MKKRFVDTFIENGEKTPAYIIAHAQWQESRGRKPSESYKSEMNSRKAIEVAYRELATHHSAVCRVAGEMVILANFTKRRCVTTSNGIEIIASPRDDGSAVVAFYYEAFDRRAAERRGFLNGLTARTFRC